MYWQEKTKWFLLSKYYWSFNTVGKTLDRYPKCGSADPSSASQERLACWTTSQPGCNPLTRCLLTWCSPAAAEGKGSKSHLIEELLLLPRIIVKKKRIRLDYVERKIVKLTLELSMISGARYQRVATYSVRNPVWSWSGSATRAKPKSQICRETADITGGLCVSVCQCEC